MSIAFRCIALDVQHTGAMTANSREQEAFDEPQALDDDRRTAECNMSSLVLMKGA